MANSPYVGQKVKGIRLEGRTPIPLKTGTPVAWHRVSDAYARGQPSADFLAFARYRRYAARA